jgi:pyrroloquinoline quinone biosynthesis protein B
MLREGRPLEIYATEMAREDLTTGNPIFNILQHYCGVHWHPVPVAERSPFQVIGGGGLEFTAVPVSSKPPPYSPHREHPRPGDNIGMRIKDLHNGKTVFYAPGLGEIEPQVRPFLEEADCVMVDGTFWTDDEMIRLGVSKKRAREIGHLPQSGPSGMIEALKPLRAGRKILIHINNTNPILNDESAERRALTEAGIEVAFDGMDITI